MLLYDIKLVTYAITGRVKDVLAKQVRRAVWVEHAFTYVLCLDSRLAPHHGGLW